MKPILLLFALPLIALAGRAADNLVFAEAFESKPDATWRWLREDPQDWRLREGSLEICVRPGDAHTVRNALVRPAPDRTHGRFTVEVTVTSLKPPTEQFEQAGITWYNAGKPVFKLVKERVDGQLMIIPGRSPMTNATVRLRVVVSSNTWSAYFRPGETGEFQAAATGDLPAPASDEVSLQCYHGPANAEHWIRFDDFRILKFDD